jgi:uncharacterized protein YaiI (UPF0178 family)
MESEREIIIVGHCRAGKHEMIRQAIKEKCVLIGVDFADITSAVYSLNMSFEAEVKLSKDSIEKLKQAIQETGSTFNASSMYIDEAKELFEKMKRTIVYEKPQSNFISRPRHNFRKR